MSDPTRQEVVDAINQGISKAQEDYKKAYESHINSEFAPEYLMTVYIFQSILELKEKCDCTYGISLEESVHKLASSLGIHGRPPDNARVWGKCDLSLIDINERPRAVIEVKKYAWDYPMDYERLAYLVKQGIEFSVFASCWFEPIEDNNSKEAEDKLNNEIQCIHEHISEDIKRLGDYLYIDIKPGSVESLLLEGETSNKNEEWKWCPFCFVIYKK